MGEEDNTRMEVRIDASEYKPEELRSPCNPEDFSWREGTRRRRRTAAAPSRGASQGATPFPRRRKLTRWFPISPLRESLSSPHPRVPLLLQMRPMKQSEVLSFMQKPLFIVFQYRFASLLNNYCVIFEKRQLV